MKAKIFFLLFLFSIAAFSEDVCLPGTGSCPACNDVSGAPSSNIVLVRDDNAKTITATLYYENSSATPPRSPINNSVVVIHVFNESFKKTLLTYTDSKGDVVFDFSKYSDRCFTAGFLFCPFANPGPTYSECGFRQCLNYSGIGCPPCNVSGLDWASGSPSGALTYHKVLPSFKTTSYCPPPPPLSATPAICFPLILIFALLGGGLFLSGKNPFSGFDFSTPRMGRHITYQPGGRGFSFDMLQAARMVTGAVSQGKSSAAAKKEGASKAAEAKAAAKKGKGKDTTPETKTAVPIGPGKGMAVSSRQLSKAEMAKRRAVAQGAAQYVKDSGEFKGVKGFFKGLGKGLATIALAAVKASFLGEILGSLGIDTNKMPGLGKLAQIFPSKTMEAMYTFKALLQASAQFGAISGKYGLKNQIFDIPGLGKARIVSFDSTSLGTMETKDGKKVAEPNCVLQITGKDGQPVQIKIEKGNITSFQVGHFETIVDEKTKKEIQIPVFERGSISFEVKEGKFVPVSMNVEGKEVTLTQQKDGYAFRAPDGQLFTVTSDDKGKMRVNDLDGNRVTGLVNKFGLEFAGSLAGVVSGEKPSVDREKLGLQIASQLNANLTHEVSFRSPELEKTFGGLVTLKNTDMAGNVEGGRFEMDVGSGKEKKTFTLENGAIIAGVDANGKALPLDEKFNKFKGTDIFLNEKIFGAVGQKYQEFTEFQQNLEGAKSDYVRAVNDERYGKSEVVDPDGNRFRIENHKITGAVSKYGEVLNVTGSGKYENTEVKAGTNATSVEGDLQRTKGIIELKRPELYEGASNLAKSPDDANSRAYLQGLVGLDDALKASVLKAYGAENKDAEAQRKALNAYVDDATKKINGIPAILRTPESVLDSLATVKGSDAHLKTLAPSSIPNVPDFSIAAGTGNVDTDRLGVSYYDPTGLNKNTPDMVGYHGLALAAAKEFGPDKDLSAAYSAVASGDADISRKALKEGLEKVGSRK